MARLLYQKLGIKELSTHAVINPPDDYDSLFLNVPFELNWQDIHQGIDFIHFFPENVADLEMQLPVLQDIINKNGMIWVSWFKNASKIPTDLKENIVRDTALSTKLVDVKKCAVDERYSGLKLVIRKHLR